MITFISSDGATSETPVHGTGMPSLISHPNARISTMGGSFSSADFHSMVWRCARLICSSKAGSVGGRLLVALQVPQAGGGKDILPVSAVFSFKRELIKVICSANESRNVAMMNEENSEYKHEEADCNIIRYFKSLIIKGHKHIQVVADDTDIFTLLVYFCWKWQYSAQISRRKSDGRVVDITATAEKLGCKY